MRAACDFALHPVNISYVGGKYVCKTNCFPLKPYFNLLNIGSKLKHYFITCYSYKIVSKIVLSQLCETIISNIDESLKKLAICASEQQFSINPQVQSAVSNCNTSSGLLHTRRDLSSTAGNNEGRSYKIMNGNAPEASACNSAPPVKQEVERKLSSSESELSAMIIKTKNVLQSWRVQRDDGAFKERRKMLAYYLIN